MADTSVVIGIDVAAVRPSTAVAVRLARRAGRGGHGATSVGTVLEWMEADHRRPDQVAALMAWIERHAPAVVGVDAPQDFKSPRRRSAGAASRAPGRDGETAPTASTARWQRACDSELLARRIRLYPVPSKEAVASGEARLPDWMSAGFDYFRRLRRAGFEIPEQAVMPGMLGGPPAAIEVYPYGAFTSLLGGLPPNKTTRAGQRLRVVTLRRAGLEWDEYFDHDSLDALAAALTAARFQQGLATPFGDPREGLIWLPVPPGDVRDSYKPL
jgi:predicted nuclease with RNAse H fold